MGRTVGDVALLLSVLAGPDTRSPIALEQPGGLPVGLQIVGPHRGDFELLQAGYAYEQATEFWRHHPGLGE